MTEQQMTKQEMVEKIFHERALFEQLIRSFTAEQLTTAGVEETWSVKDILHHITAWEQLMCQWLEEAMRDETPQRPSDWDEIHALNAQIAERGRSRSLDEVLADFYTSSERVLRVVTAVPEDALFDPNRFAWREGDPLWHMVGGNTFWHYADHEKPIRAWLAQQSD